MQAVLSDWGVVVVGWVIALALAIGAAVTIGWVTAVVRQRRLYDDPRWIRMSRAHLRWHPDCSVTGCDEPASDVDHIIPVVLAPERFLDPTNIQSLCKGHHSRLTRAFDAGSLAGACDVHGNTLDPHHPWAQPSQTDAIRVANTPRPRAPATLAARLKQQTIRGQRR